MENRGFYQEPGMISSVGNAVAVMWDIERYSPIPNGT